MSSLQVALWCGYFSGYIAVVYYAYRRASLARVRVQAILKDRFRDGEWKFVEKAYRWGTAQYFAGGIASSVLGALVVIVMPHAKGGALVIPLVLYVAVVRGLVIRLMSMQVGQAVYTKNYIIALDWRREKWVRIKNDTIRDIRFSLYSDMCILYGYDRKHVMYYVSDERFLNLVRQHGARRYVQIGSKGP